MLHQTAYATPYTPLGAAMMETFASRFGDISVDTDKAFLFPRGLLGMPDKYRFALSKFPGEKMQQFTLLQSLDDPALSFITLPVEAHNRIIAHHDILGACRDLQIDDANLVILLIASVHRTPGQTRLSVNARAPLFIDAQRHIGAQYVFHQDTYKVQHMI